MTTEEILLAAAALVRKGWTKGIYARDALGQQCGVQYADAVCFCAEGAIYRASVSSAESAAVTRLCAILPAAPSGHPVQNKIAYFNDIVAKNAEEVAQMLEKAARS